MHWLVRDGASRPGYAVLMADDWRTTPPDEWPPEIVNQIQRSLRAGNFGDLELFYLRATSDFWTAKPPNLLSPENLTKVRHALEAGIVCGIHRGGGGPEPCAFADIASYLRAIDESRPGDWFTLWSVPMLAERGLLLIDKRQEPVAQHEFQTAKNWLDGDPRREFLAVGCPANGGSAEAEWGDGDFFERIEDLAERYAPSGTFAVLALTKLQHDDLSAIPDLVLVDAKRPNDRGEVPFRGYY